MEQLVHFWGAGCILVLPLQNAKHLVQHIKEIDGGGWRKCDLATNGNDGGRDGCGVFLWDPSFKIAQHNRNRRPVKKRIKHLPRIEVRPMPVIDYLVLSLFGWIRHSVSPIK